MKKGSLRVEIDNTGERLGKLIRTAEVEKIPVVAVIGKREVETNTLSIRTRKSGDLGALTVNDIISRLQQVVTTTIEKLARQLLKKVYPQFLLGAYPVESNLPNVLTTQLMYVQDESLHSVPPNS